MQSQQHPLRVPNRLFYGEQMSTLMLHLYHAHKKDQGATGQLLGYTTPWFQRSNDKWSTTDQERFIESVYMGANIGSFMINAPVHCIDPSMHNVILDGLQRLTAIKNYFDGQISLLADDGNRYTWLDLTDDEQSRFLRIQFPWLMTSYETEEQMIQAYERHNFTGKPHTQEDLQHIRSRPT